MRDDQPTSTHMPKTATTTTNSQLTPLRRLVTEYNKNMKQIHESTNFNDMFEHLVKPILRVPVNECKRITVCKETNLMRIPDNTAPDAKKPRMACAPVYMLVVKLVSSLCSRQQDQLLRMLSLHTKSEKVARGCVTHLVDILSDAGVNIPQNVSTMQSKRVRESKELACREERESEVLEVHRSQQKQNEELTTVKVKNGELATNASWMKRDISKLEDKVNAQREEIATLREDNARLREENLRNECKIEKEIDFANYKMDYMQKMLNERDDEVKRLRALSA